MEQSTTQVETLPVREAAAAYASASTEQPSLEFVLTMASRLALTEQLQVIQFLAERLSAATRTAAKPQGHKKKSRSLRGLWADLGPGLSAEDIDASRREMLANFPRDDF
ncbi:MAG: hypothetical protein HY328_08895 [Chloroflexi bacterium]|nr:hypothetical protein [Chloroflexota bacterium]